MNATLELTAAIGPVNGHHQSLAPAASALLAKHDPRPEPLPVLCRGIPIARDREIFRQVVICRRTKTDVARQFQLSQPRITQICDRVTEWMKEHTQTHTEEMTQPQQLNLAENLCRQRLEAQYALAMEAFEASRGPRQWEGWDHEGSRLEKPPEGNQRPQCAFLNTALKTTIELARLDGVWGSGDAWAGRNRQKLLEFQRQRDDQWNAETAQHEAMLARIRDTREQQRAPAASRSPAAIEGTPAAAYERLWNSAPATALDAEVASTAEDATDAATEACGDGQSRILDSDVPFGRPKTAYAPQGEPVLAPAAQQPRRLLLADRQRALRRQRLRKELLAPLSRRRPQLPLVESAPRQNQGLRFP